MNPEDIVRNVRALLRANRIMAEVRMKHMMVGLGLRAFAAMFAAFGLLMLELAAWFAMIQIWSAIVSAIVLGIVNFALAGVIVLIASKAPSGRELELATEIHDHAMNALQMQAQGVQTQFMETVRNPLNSVLPTLLVPLASIILRSIRRSRQQAAPGGSPPEA